MLANLDNNQLVCDSHMNCMLKDDLVRGLVTNDAMRDAIVKNDLRKTDKMSIEGDFQASSDLARAPVVNDV